MIERFENLSPIEPRIIDRLVDGELTRAEEQTLLAALEVQPDGWRHCALAFLEARVWKDELAAVARHGCSRMNGTPVALSSPAVDDTSTKVAGARNASAQWTRTIAVAVSIGLAFVLGIAARGYWTTNDSPVDNQIAANGNEHGTAASGIPAGGTGQLTREGIQPTVTMTLVDERGDIERQLEIPIVETNSFDPRFFKRPPSAIPQNLVSALRRSGHTVEEQRLFVPVMLDDGRQAIIPLDQAEVKFQGAHY